MGVEVGLLGAAGLAVINAGIGVLILKVSCGPSGRCAIVMHQP